MLYNWSIATSVCCVTIDDCIFQDAESEGAKAFKEVAAGIDEIPFALTSNEDLFKEHDMEADGVMLFKKVRANLSVELFLLVFKTYNICAKIGS